MKRILAVATIIFTLSACVADIESTELVGQYKTERITLQERNPRLHRQWSKPRGMITRVASGNASAENYLGKGYKIVSTTVGDNSNATAPVVDIAKIRASEKDNTYISIAPTRLTEIEMSSYSNSKRFEEKSSWTKKIGAGFKLSAGMFEGNFESDYKQNFASTNIDESESVYGEMNIEYRHEEHNMQTTLTARRMIAAKYFDNGFLENLYNVPVTQVRDGFGDFVVTGYYSGGRATALYQGKDNASSMAEAKEKELSLAMSASVKFGGSVGASLSFNWNKAESNMQNSRIQKAYTRIRTSGGMPTSATPVSDIEHSNIDLTGWLASLNSTDSHTLIAIKDEGLYPLADFIMEENFSRRLLDSHAGYLPKQQELIEPFIEIVRLYVRKVGKEKLYDIVPILNTRQGDKLIISNTLSSKKADEELRIYSNPDNFMARANKVLSEVGRYFNGIRIEARPKVVINPILLNPLVFDLAGINAGEMCKLLYTDSNVCYICDMKKRIAFSYYYDPFFADIYGMSDWVDNLPESSKVNINAIAKYFRVFGL